jgi:hypothetical protein
VSGLLKALSYSCISYWSAFIGNYIYLLDSRIAKGPLVKRGNIFS